MEKICAVFIFRPPQQERILKWSKFPWLLRTGIFTMQNMKKPISPRLEDHEQFEVYWKLSKTPLSTRLELGLTSWYGPWFSNSCFAHGSFFKVEISNSSWCRTGKSHSLIYFNSSLLIDKNGVWVCYPFLSCQTQPLQLQRQPCWLKEFELHTVKPESQTNPLQGVATSSKRHSASLISPGKEPGRTLQPP